MSRSWSSGSTRAWRKIRARVLLRDGYQCQIRVPGICTLHARVQGGHVHHLHGKDRCPGCRADDMGHLVAACRECNLHVGEPTPAAVDPPNRGVTKW